MKTDQNNHKQLTDEEFHRFINAASGRHLKLFSHSNIPDPKPPDETSENIAGEVGKTDTGVSLGSSNGQFDKYHSQKIIIVQSVTPKGPVTIITVIRDGKVSNPFPPKV